MVTYLCWLLTESTEVTGIFTPCSSPKSLVVSLIVIFRILYSIPGYTPMLARRPRSLPVLSTGTTISPWPYTTCNMKEMERKGVGYLRTMKRTNMTSVSVRGQWNIFLTTEIPFLMSLGMAKSMRTLARCSLGNWMDESGKVQGRCGNPLTTTNEERSSNPTAWATFFISIFVETPEKKDKRKSKLQYRGGIN